MASKKIDQLQLTQQNLQTVAAQKQQLELQVAELDSALKEVTAAKESFKIIGKIMVAAAKESLMKELEDKKELVSLRLKNFSKQEESLSKMVEELQKEVMAEMKNE